MDIYEQGEFVCLEHCSSSVLVIDEFEQRELLLWFKTHRPMMWRDIFCDDCPEVC